MLFRSYNKEPGECFHDYSKLSPGINLLYRIIQLNSCNRAFQNPKLLSETLPPFAQTQPFVYKQRFPDIMEREKIAIPLIPDSKPTESKCKSSKKSIDESDFSLKTTKTKSNAYKRRNVYKSIIRHMISYLHENRKSLVSKLEEKGCSQSDINSSLQRIRCLYNTDDKKGNPRRPQHMIDQIIRSKNASMWILKESLKAMMKELETKNITKIMKKNVNIYIEVCKKYYNQCIKSLP